MNTLQHATVKEIETLETETLNAILKGQKETVKSLFSKAELLFREGSASTRSLVTNKFIFPLSTLMEMNYSWGKQFLDIMPKNLKHEYCSQIYSSGI
jgi:hypothetical protein